MIIDMIKPISIASWAMAMVVGCSGGDSAATIVTPAEMVDVQGLRNVFRVTPMLYSGSGPDTEAAFASLKSLGIKTVLSVDGATPDVALAEKHGLRYVHVPVGYDGIGQSAALTMARAVQTLPGPVYVHCHHGKHRGPAAVAAIRLCLENDYTPAAANAWLEQAGTDPKYKGLVRLPTTLKRPKPGEIEAISTDFPKSATVFDLTRHMVHVAIHWEAIHAASRAGITKAESPAVLLVEDYREVKRTNLGYGKGEDFVRLVTEAEKTAQSIVDAAKAGNASAFQAAIQASETLCTRCHSQYRD
jgi:protein tyrosine phosphatase (PTP) superfamily phosphohydrolase (DUF442 family)